MGMKMVTRLGCLAANHILQHHIVLNITMFPVTGTWQVVQYFDVDFLAQLCLPIFIFYDEGIQTTATSWYGEFTFTQTQNAHINFCLYSAFKTSLFMKT